MNTKDIWQVSFITVTIKAGWESEIHDVDEIRSERVLSNKLKPDGNPP